MVRQVWAKPSVRDVLWWVWPPSRAPSPLRVRTRILRRRCISRSLTTEFHQQTLLLLHRRHCCHMLWTKKAQLHRNSLRVQALSWHSALQFQEAELLQPTLILPWRLGALHELTGKRLPGGIQAQGMRRRPMQVWVSCSGSRLPVVHTPWVGDQCGEQRDPDLNHSTTKHRQPGANSLQEPKPQTVNISAWRQGTAEGSLVTVRHQDRLFSRSES